jgi:hypothetical protein
VGAGVLGNARPAERRRRWPGPFDVGMPLLFAPYVRVAVPLITPDTHPESALKRATPLAPLALHRFGMIVIAALLAGSSSTAAGARVTERRAGSILLVLSPPAHLLDSVLRRAAVRVPVPPRIHAHRAA